MIKKNFQSYRIGQSTLEYSLLVIVLVGAFLGIQAYLKRSMQGQYQMAADQQANQYAYGLTNAHEHFETEVRTTEWKLPGPADIIKVRGSFETDSTSSIAPLSRNLYHKQ